MPRIAGPNTKMIRRADWVVVDIDACGVVLVRSAFPITRNRQFSETCNGGSMSKLRVSDAISGLREELSKAMKNSSGEDIRFRVKSLSLELTAEVEWDAEGSAKASWFVFEGKAGTKRANITTQKLNLDLEVVSDDGGEFKMSRSKE